VKNGMDIDSGCNRLCDTGDGVCCDDKPGEECGVFAIYNDAMIYQDPERARGLYQIRLAEDERADKCEKCGDCLELCPQQIPIPDWMEKAHQLLAPKQ